FQASNDERTQHRYSDKGRDPPDAAGDGDGKWFFPRADDLCQRLHYLARGDTLRLGIQRDRRGTFVIVVGIGVEAVADLTPGVDVDTGASVFCCPRLGCEVGCCTARERLAQRICWRMQRV